MINIATLDALQDDELRSVIQQSETLLKKRDDERKARAVVDARAILAAAGLCLKDLNGNGKKKSKEMIYHGGHTYQHPNNKTLVWNAKGQKPNWLRELEAQGGKATEVIGMSATESKKVG